MKPKKATAPSNSQRDGQDNWKKEFDQNFVGVETHFSDWLTNENGRKIKVFIQQQKDDSYCVGVREAEEKRKRYSFITAKGTHCSCGCEERIKEVREESFQAGFQEAVEKIDDVKRVCSAEQNNESPEGCDCSVWNGALDELKSRLTPTPATKER